MHSGPWVLGPVLLTWFLVSTGYQDGTLGGNDGLSVPTLVLDGGGVSYGNGREAQGGVGGESLYRLPLP